MIVTFTQFKPVLLPTQQANKTTDELLAQGIETLFGKRADQEDGGPRPKETILPELECRLLFY